jgi:preprotein translocase subunit SecD
VINQILTYVFGGLAALLLGWGYFKRPKRAVLWFAALCAGAAAATAHFDSFWAMVALAILTLWSMIAALDFSDLNWRMRFGLVFNLVVLAVLSLWPSVSEMSGGAVPCPDYLCAPRGPDRDQDPRINFKLGRGLDLRGGLRLVYTVDVDEAIKDRRDRYYEDMRTALAKQYGFHTGNKVPTEEALTQLREKVKIEAPRDRPNTVTLDFANEADVTSMIDARFREQFRAEMLPEINGSHVEFVVSEDAESAIRTSAVAQAKEIILRRVDELGLKEAAVSTRDEDIIVEVPGESEATFAEIREIISETARLEFKLLDDGTDFFASIADKIQRTGEFPLEGLEFRRETAPLGVDDEGQETTKVITFAQLPIAPGEEPKETLERFKTWTDTLELPPDREIGFGLEYKLVDQVTLKEEPEAWRTYFLKSRAEITGDMITDASAEPRQDQGALGGWVTGIRFSEKGGAIFSKITKANVKKRFAIILDDRISSAPRINTHIAGGSAIITSGSNDPEIQLREAKKLELVLRAGALPAPISPSNEQRIGPSLGKDAIDLGVEGALVSALLVVAFMVLYYQRAGVIADLSVGMNLFLQLAILASLSASMTLPGIAGLALTVGMSVDSNVLINERIREELRGGKSPRAAVEIGYSRALSAIVDGHITTFISGVVLAQFGTGPIKGFAVTLMVGVITSIFCGVVVSRVLFDFWVRRLPRGAKLDMG